MGSKRAQWSESSILSSPAGSAALATIKTKELPAYGTSVEGDTVRARPLRPLKHPLNSVLAGVMTDDGRSGRVPTVTRFGVARERQGRDRGKGEPS